METLKKPEDIRKAADSVVDARFKAFKDAAERIEDAELKERVLKQIRHLEKKRENSVKAAVFNAARPVRKTPAKRPGTPKDAPKKK